MEIRARIANLSDCARIKHQVMTDIRQKFVDLLEVVMDNIELVLGEQLDNIAKYGVHNEGVSEEVVVDIRVDGENLYLVVESESVRNNCDVLSLALGHAQECVNHEIGCDFLVAEHGLGLFITARCTRQSSYSEGVFRATFSTMEDDSRRHIAALVDVALV